MSISREPTMIPTHATAHRTVTRIDSTNIMTDTTVSKLVCNCGHETIYYHDLTEARADMEVHHDLVNRHKTPESLNCFACTGTGQVNSKPCHWCDGTGIRKDIKSTVDTNGKSTNIDVMGVDT